MTTVSSLMTISTYEIGGIAGTASIFLRLAHSNFMTLIDLVMLSELHTARNNLTKKYHNMIEKFHFVAIKMKVKFIIKIN